MKSGLVHAVESQILDFNHLMEGLANKKAEVSIKCVISDSTHGRKLSLKRGLPGNWLNSCNRRDLVQRRGHSI